MLRSRRHFGWALWAGLWVVALTGCADPYAKAMEARAAGDLAQAVGWLERVPTTHGSYAETHALLPALRFQAGRAAFEEERWRDAIALLRKVKPQQAEHEEAQDLIGCAFFHLGEEAFELGDYEAAVRLASTVRTSCSHAEQARVLMVRAQERMEAGS